MDIHIAIPFFSHSINILIPKHWIRFGIVAFALLFSTVAAYWGSTKIHILLLALLWGIGGAIILVQQPNLGFILIFLGGMFVPFVGPSGLNAAVLMVAALIGLWFMDMFVLKRKFEFINNRVTFSAIVFLVISTISFGMGQISWFAFTHQAPLPAQAGGYAIFVLSIGALLVTAHLIRDIYWLKIIVWSFIGLGAIYVFGRSVRFPYIDRIYDNGFTAGSMFWTWLVALTLGQAIFNTQLTIRIRGLLMLIVLATFYVGYVQANDWKSGWVPPLIAAAALMGLRFKRLTLLAIPFGLIAVITLAFKLIGTDEYSWGTRVDAWIIILEISKVSPLLGLGFSNYYWYTPLFPIRGWRVSFNSHSQYVDLIAQVGIIGFVCFFWIFFEIGRLGWGLIKGLPDGFARAYAYGVLGGLAGTLMAAFLVDWVLPFVYNIGLRGFRASILPWIFFGGLISVEQIFKTNPNALYHKSTFQEE
jgi:hypothetical protein